MASSSQAPNSGGFMPANIAPRKPHVLLAACGSVSAKRFGVLCHLFSEWAEVKAVVTKQSLEYIDRQYIPSNVTVYTDDDERFSWKNILDKFLHIELRQWADVMVIAPLSANSLAKIARGFCDNLLTCIVRAWDYKNQLLFIAPEMNPLTWDNPFTETHLMELDNLGVIYIAPQKDILPSREIVTGAMAEPSDIWLTVQSVFKQQKLAKRKLTDIS